MPPSLQVEMDAKTRKAPQDGLLVCIVAHGNDGTRRTDGHGIVLAGRCETAIAWTPVAVACRACFVTRGREDR